MTHIGNKFLPLALKLGYVPLPDIAHNDVVDEDFLYIAKVHLWSEKKQEREYLHEPGARPLRC